MFARFDTWIIMGIFLWLFLGCALAWASNTKKRLDAAEKKNVDLRFALNRKTAELHQVKAELNQARANAEAIRNLVILDKNDAIEILREKLNASERERERLETLLNQKWSKAKTKGGEN